MKKASKLISTLLTVAMVGTLLAGCGGSSSNTTTTESVADKGTASTETASSGETGLDTSEEVELVMYVVSNEPAKQQELTDNMNKIFKGKAELYAENQLYRLGGIPQQVSAAVLLRRSL